MIRLTKLLQPMAGITRGGGGGSGGGSQTSYSGLPKEFIPYVETALKDAGTAFEKGQLSNVEGLTEEQQDAFRRKKELGRQGGTLDQLASESYDAAGAFRDAAEGTGLFGAKAIADQAKALEDTIGEAQREQLGTLQGQSALGGGLGSARATSSIDKALLDTAADISSSELNARRAASLQGAQGVIGSAAPIAQQLSAGISATEGVGSAIQQQKQNEQDAVYQGLNRLFGLYGSAPAKETTTTTSGGGK